MNYYKLISDAQSFEAYKSILALPAKYQMNISN